MAINFLDNVQFNQNQLLGARIENVTSDPGTANGGDIIFNSTTGKLKYYDGTTPFSSAGWISLPDGTGIGGSGTVDSIPVFNGTSEITDSQLEVSGTGSTQTFLFNSNGQVALKGNLVIDNAGIKDVNGSLGVNGYVLYSNGSQIEWASAPVGYSGWGIKPDSLGNTLTIGSSDFVNVSGTGSVVTTISSAVGGANLSIGLSNNVSIVGDLTVGGGDITLTGTGRIQGIDTVTTGTDAASKQYVDNAISGSGSLIFQGGYNASTNTPNLDNTPTLDILKGWTYVVTVGGSFFTETVEVGDLLIAEINDPTTLADWTTVQNNIDLATLTNVGIGNVIPSALNDQLGIGVVYNGSGTAALGLDIAGLTESGGTGSIAQSDDLLVFQDVSTTPSKNYKITVANLSTALSATGAVFATGSGSASYFITHNFGTRNVIVEVYETASPYQTVYGTVTRPNVNQVKIEFGSATAGLTFMCKKL